MSVAEAVQTTAKPQSSAASGLLLQRKCACGGSAGFTSECSDCRTNKLLGKPLQTKLRVNEPGDEYEREADRVSEEVMRMSDAPADREAPPTSTAPLVQRRVNGGGTTGIGTAPPIVHDVLASPGQPLAATTRAFFEPRFGHDFGHVRIHADSRAAESARSVSALAYTVGHHVIFGAGHSVQRGASGERLLAHELTHVIQQQRGSSGTGNEIMQGWPPDTTEVRGSVSALPTKMVSRQSLPSWAKETFTWNELDAYVNSIMSNNQIEGGWGSDNKARAYVQRAVESVGRFDLPPQLQTLLILELLNGTVTSEDQEAVLTILERSSPEDHQAIFGPGGVAVDELFSKITEEQEKKRLVLYWAKWIGEFIGEMAREHNEKTLERLDHAIGDYEKAKKDNLVFAKSGPAWEAKLASVAEGKYKHWHDLWTAGEYNRFALAVASIQSAHGVQEDDIDGVLGPQTWARLAGVGEAIASVEKVTWPESEETCTLAARERIFRGYEMATGETIEIPEGKSEKVANWILHSRTERMKDLPVEYRATGAAGLAVYLGIGEFVSESDIWEGKLKPGAVLQVWGGRKNYDLMRAGTTSGEGFYGTNFVFVRYDTETNERMWTRHLGESEWMSKDEYEVWIAANMITPETELPLP